jgi:uncharacterized membrane protein required for colicin V production
MTWLDLVVVATICIFAALGFWKGILRTVIGIAALLLGLFFAGALYGRLAEFLWPDGRGWSLVASFALILVGTLVVGAIAAAIVSRAVHMTALGLVDRAIGLATGALVAIVAWGAVLALLMHVLPGMDGLVGESPVATLVVNWFVQLTGLGSQPGQPV